MWVPCLYGELSNALLPLFPPNKPQFCSAIFPSPMRSWGRQSIHIPTLRGRFYSKSGLLSTIDIISQLVLCCGELAILCRKLSSTPGLSLFTGCQKYSLLLSCDDQNCLQTLPSTPQEQICSSSFHHGWELECLRGVKLSYLKLLFLSFFVIGDDELLYPSWIKYFCYLQPKASTSNTGITANSYLLFLGLVLLNFFST